MIEGLRHSLRRKVLLLVLASTVAALALSALGLVIYDLRAYERQWTGDLNTQAELLARTSAAALSFGDRETAARDLAVLKVRPRVTGAAIYTREGELFATYTKSGTGSVAFPPRPEADGYRIEGDDLVVFRRVVEGSEPIGTIYLRAFYRPWDRLIDYLGILGAVMIASLGVAALLSGWLQRAVTQPILDVARVARQVIDHHDYSLRATKNTDDEIGELVDSFNAMLAEAGRRAEALREADRRKDEFLATLAHELRNPLAPLRNSLEILRMPQANEAMRDKARQMMERQLAQMVRLVDDLLDVSRITTGKLGIRKSLLEVQAAVRDAIETARPYVESRNHQLEVQLPSQALCVEGDRTRLAQVFANLLHNAAKYTEPGGYITLSLAAEGDEAVARVRDNGIGLAPESLAAIFDMFVQVDRSLERQQAGLGVGLTLSRQLVGLHNGTISAKSEGAGKGSEFTVRLPLAGATLPQSRAHAPPPHAGQRRRILLADDNADFAASLAAVLSARGHEVRVARDGAEALATAAAFNPDFAFLDLGMPKVHGYEVARRLRELPATAECVLVAVTGWGHEDDRNRAREAGFDRHLVKPVDAADIDAILASY
jgi:signal transduction histidine kinase/CheY-like chemotaxis protein